MELTRRLLEAANELSSEINQAREEGEKQFGKRVKRTRFEDAAGEQADSTAG